MQNKLVYVVIIISVALGFATLTRGHDWGDDFASYIMQAQSISEGTIQTFVEHNSFTINESSGYIGPVTYPWGYPMFLVPAYLLRGVHPIVLKLPGLIFFAGFLACLYLLMKTRFTSTESLVAVSLFAFNPMLIRFLDQILSDIPFLFFSTLTLLLIARDRNFTVRNAIWIGLSIGFAFFIRKQGILLLAGYLAAILWDAWQNRTDVARIKAGGKYVLLVSVSFAFVWLATTAIFPGEGESYFAQYGAFQLKTVFEFIGRYITLFGLFFGDNRAWQALYWITVIFFLIGLWTEWNEEKTFILFFVGWMLLLFTWPFWQGERFIFPLFPIFIYFMFLGMKTTIERLSPSYRRYGKMTFYAFGVVVAALFLFTSGMNAYINLRDNRDIAGPFDPYSDEMFNFIKADTSPDSVIIFFKPRAMRLLTNRDSILVTACDRLDQGDYVVIHKKWDNSQIPPDEVDECGPSLKSVFENRRFIVYQILK